jgi:hypothetical protein
LLTACQLFLNYHPAPAPSFIANYSSTTTLLRLLSLLPNPPPPLLAFVFFFSLAFCVFFTKSNQLTIEK